MPDSIAKSLFIPDQKKAALASVPSDMVAFIATYPPLEQVSQLKTAETTFHAVLEVPASLANEPWQLALWHSNNDGDGKGGGEWAEDGFVPTGRDHHPSTLQDVGGTLARLYFTAVLTVQSPMSFTVKFRQQPDHDWRWIRDELGLTDGIVLVDGAPIHEGDSEGLPDLIRGLNPDLGWKTVMSQCPGTRLWSVEAPVKGADGDNSTIVDIPVGVPWGSFLRWFALVRNWTPWLAPRHGKTAFELDKDAMLCSFLSPEGKHLVFLGISGLGNVMSLFRSGDKGELILHVRNDDSEAGTGTILVAAGDKFESANAAVMYHARDLVASNKVAAGEIEAETKALGDGVRPAWYENWYDGLGYCTWNALGQRLTEEKVLGAVDTLAENKINIASLIIDDNWQDIDYRGDGQFQYGWNDFEAEPKTFPKGLKSLISEIRSRHKNIQHVAVWHALLGYWAGVAPEGGIAKRYKTVEVVRENSERRNLPLGGKITVVSKEDAHKFYDDFYRFLASCGIDGVKTDAQFMVDTWVSAKARTELTHTYLDAWTIASLRHFSSHVISCMSQSPQIIFYSQLPRNRPAVVCRNSDDFFPNVASSHPWHVWANAHNSLLTQHLNILPDWDMFQTVHDYSGFHAAARCVSGGPIYITDVPGAHDIGLIKQMTGVTPRGKTVIFRPSVLGRSLDQYVTYHDLSLLKIAAYHGRAATGTPILGLFNISTRPVTELVSLSRFSGVLPSLYYIVQSHRSGKVTRPLQTSEPASLLTVSLDVRDYDILCAFPLSVFSTRAHGQVFVATLGLVGKMTGCAAILNSRATLRENGDLQVDTNLKALGVLGIYISSLPSLSLKDTVIATIQGQPIPFHTASVSKSDEHIMELDIEAAWNEMGLESGWANEVEVKVFFALDK